MGTWFIENNRDRISDKKFPSTGNEKIYLQKERDHYLDDQQGISVI